MLRIDGVNNPSLPVAINRKIGGKLMSDIHFWQLVVRNISLVIDLDLDADVVAGYSPSCAVFLIGERVVIKIFPPFFAGDFAKELASFATLHGCIETKPTLLVTATELNGRFWFWDFVQAEIELFLGQMGMALKREPAVVVNADLTEDHILLIKEEGRWRLAAIIDWEDTVIAPSTYEWIVAWFGFAACIRPCFGH